MSGTITMTGEEYDALHAEAEALRAENGRLKRTIDAGVENELAHIEERARLSAELEAARGLLRECHSEFDTCEASGFEVRMRQRIAAYLTATPAPEVQAEQGERQEAVAAVGAVIDRKRKVFSIDILDAAALHPGTKLYTTPQPTP